MRRISSRKRNKFNLKNINNRTLKIIIILIILLITIIFIYLYFIKNIFIKHNFEKQYTYISNLNEKTIFSLNKIILFSSATVNTNELNNSVWNLDISGYTDICIYLNNISRNIVKQLYIDNIKISQSEYGTPCLYRKSIQDFGKCSFTEDKILYNKIDFNIVEKDTTIKDETIEVYNDLSTPITIGFYNKNIKTNFLDSHSQVEYNGKILKKARIPQTSINCNVSFNINIINELNEQYVCNINFDIPFENGNSSIYEDGYITKEINNLDNYKFLRIQ